MSIDSVLNNDSRSSFSRMRSFAAVALVLCVAVACAGGNVAKTETCGKRKVNDAAGPFLERGPSLHGRWPWHASIFIREEGKSHYNCDGTIIGKNVILTSGHCVQYSTENIFVHVGAIDLNVLDRQSGYEVLKVILHPNFTNHVNDDIAVIKLKSDLAMTSYVQPICFGYMKEDNLYEISGSVVGLSANEQGAASHLQEASLTVVDGYACAGNDDRFRAVITSKVYCAEANNGSSPCDGSSGRGMFFEEKGKWFIGGLQSLTATGDNGSCDPSKFVIFTYVKKYVDWVQSVVPRGSLAYTPVPCERTGTCAGNNINNAARRIEHGSLLVGVLLTSTFSSRFTMD